MIGDGVNMKKCIPSMVTRQAHLTSVGICEGPGSFKLDYERDQTISWREVFFSSWASQ